LLLLLPAATSASEAEITASAPAPSNRTSLPFTVSFALSGPIPGLGLDLSYQLHDRLAVGVQATTILAHTDINLRSRAFLLARPTWGLYAGLNARLWHSPILFNGGVRPLADAEIGYEWRGPGGFTLGLGAGLGALLTSCCDDQPGPRATRWMMPVVMTNFRLGTSF